MRMIPELGDLFKTGTKDEYCIFISDQEAVILQTGPIGGYGMRKEKVTDLNGFTHITNSDGIPEPVLVACECVRLAIIGLSYLPFSHKPQS